MNMEQQAGNIAEKLDNVLDVVYTTHLKKKAKTIIITSVEFVLVDIFIVYEAYQNVETMEENVRFGLQIMSLVAAGYAALVAVFVFVHALVLSDTAKVNPKLEAAYQKTNNVAVIDSILELPLAFKFKGPLWWLVWVFWALFAGICSLFIVLSVLGTDFNLSDSSYAALAVAITQLYEITGDFSEYWISTRNRSEAPLQTFIEK